VVHGFRYGVAYEEELDAIEPQAAPDAADSASAASAGTTVTTALAASAASTAASAASTAASAADTADTRTTVLEPKVVDTARTVNFVTSGAAEEEQEAIADSGEVQENDKKE
jgi:hypothetical protein